MKSIFTIILITCICSSVSGQDRTVETDDGKTILLKANKTWEYVEGDEPITPAKKENCSHSSADFMEPRGNTEIKEWLENYELTAQDLKKVVAKENDCSPEKVKITRISESKENGEYGFCVAGKEMAYVRNAVLFHKKGQDPKRNY